MHSSLIFNPMFTDRLEAGTLLAHQLIHYKNDNGIVLGVPRGGVPVAFPIAETLNFPLEIILTKKIGHPLYKEYAIGAASLNEHFVIPGMAVDEKYIEASLVRIRRRLKEMYNQYMGDRKPTDIKGKTVILVDDGIATGNTILASLHVLNAAHPGKIVIAVPVISKSAYDMLSKEADAVETLLIPEDFHGVGQYYEDFRQTTDEEVMHYLSRSRKERIR
jgi:predicted phosphoribosyltransferase